VEDGREEGEVTGRRGTETRRREEGRVMDEGETRETRERRRRRGRQEGRETRRASKRWDSTCRAGPSTHAGTSNDMIVALRFDLHRPSTHAGRRRGARPGRWPSRAARAALVAGGAAPVAHAPPPAAGQPRHRRRRTVGPLIQRPHTRGRTMRRSSTPHSTPLHTTPHTSTPHSTPPPTTTTLARAGDTPEERAAG
jgi:hypothetical protein